MLSNLKQKLKLFLPRLIISTLLVSVFFIAIQDILIFPGVINGLFQSNSSKSTAPKEVKEHFIKTVDGVSIQAWYFGSLEKETDTLAIVLTGNADSLSRGGFYYQRWLASINIPSIAFSYRGYGKSSGWPSEAGLKKDIDAVYKFAKALNKQALKPKKILIFSISVGTGPGAYIAIKEKVDTLVMMSPYTSLKEVAKDMPLYGYLTPFLKTNFPTKDLFMQTTNFPCTILVHGLKDTTIPPKHSEELFNIISSKAEVKHLTYKNGKHNNILHFARKELEKEIVNCLLPK